MDMDNFMSWFFKYVFPFLFIGMLFLIPINAYMVASNNQMLLARQGIQVSKFQALFMHPVIVTSNQVQVVTPP